MSSTPGECIDLPDGKPDSNDEEGQQVSSWEPPEPSAANEDGEGRQIDLNSLAQTTKVDPGFGLDVEAVLPFLEFDYERPVVFGVDGDDDSGIYNIE
jgi:hypothetical protein